MWVEYGIPEPDHTGWEFGKEEGNEDPAGLDLQKLAAPVLYGYIDGDDLELVV